MGLILAIAFGGALGSVLRYVVSKALQEKVGIDFPFGTLFVNITASFFIGFFFAYLVEKLTISPTFRAFLITGFLGGYSTFSTLTYESYSLLMNGEIVKFIFYAVGSLLSGIFMTLLGYNLGRML
ncbi:MAG: fluoride efflux transporter CrcB [Hydrogenobacter thermophilus]|uniref:fluoride efflux transporter CrcB n=1 Tax=Hydrogenobacter thermophilus TaxID=940 RepID=UPI001C740329|nr:fluoride efflux transporter CrcB [Hydrogenobacter thermophilus]QWK20297.1 MAG: fluoride efflux transporter CrcB [Hydrogenobacter thermophilus]